MAKSWHLRRTHDIRMVVAGHLGFDMPTHTGFDMNNDKVLHSLGNSIDSKFGTIFDN